MINSKKTSKPKSDKPLSKSDKNNLKKRTRSEAKYHEEYVEFFPSNKSKDSGDFLFNRAPVIKKSAKELKAEKKTKKKNHNITVYEDVENYDSDDQQNTKKRIKTNDIFDDFEEGLLTSNADNFVEYFLNNQSSFKSMAKMSSFV